MAGGGGGVGEEGEHQGHEALCTAGNASKVISAVLGAVLLSLCAGRTSEIRTTLR